MTSIWLSATLSSRSANDALAAKRGEEQKMLDPDISVSIFSGDLWTDEYTEAGKRNGAERRRRPALVPLQRPGPALLRVHHHCPRHPRALPRQPAQGHHQVRRGDERQATPTRDLPVYRYDMLVLFDFFFFFYYPRIIFCVVFLSLFFITLDHRIEFFFLYDQ